MLFLEYGSYKIKKIYIFRYIAHNTKIFIVKKYD